MFARGTVVKIKPIEWYIKKCSEANEDFFRVGNPSCRFTQEMSQYCGKEAIIQGIVDPNRYLIMIDGHPTPHYWIYEFFEEMNEFKVDREGDVIILSYEDKTIEFDANTTMDLMMKLAESL